MSNTYYASAIRFQKRYRAPTLTATSAAYTAAVAAWQAMPNQPWYKVSKDKRATLTPHDTSAKGEPADREYYDAYELCAEHASSMHRAYAGMSAYRIMLPDAAVGLTLESIAMSVSSCPYNPYGARIAVKTSSDVVPTRCWTCAREGGVASADKNFAAGVSPRTASEDGATWYGATSTCTIAPAAGLVLQKYLYVFVSLENYQRSRNGWLEGSSIVVPVFSLTLSSAAAGFDDGDNIGGGYGDAAPLIVSADGVVIAPADTGEPRSTVREIAMRSVAFSHTPSKSDPSPANAVAAIPTLLAALASSGLQAVDQGKIPLESWTHLQRGMSCSVDRRIIGSASPFEQHLALTLSAMAVVCAMPVDFEPSVLRLTHRNDEPEISIDGADLALAAYWVSLRSLSIGEVALLFQGANIAFGSEDISAGGVAAVRIGRVDLPASIPPGYEIAIPISPITDRYGTLVLVPYVVRVTAAHLSVGEPVGLAGLTVGSDTVDGAGWIPNVQLEV